MSNRQWVDQVRELLAKAKQQRSAAFASLDSLKASIDEALTTANHATEEAAVVDVREIPYPIRRRHLIAQIGLHARHYELSAEVQAFVYAAGRTTTSKLDMEQLEALHGWLNRVVDRLQTACDIETAPPAR